MYEKYSTRECFEANARLLLVLHFLLSLDTPLVLHFSYSIRSSALLISSQTYRVINQCLIQKALSASIFAPLSRNFTHTDTRGPPRTESKVNNDFKSLAFLNLKTSLKLVNFRIFQVTDLIIE